MPASDETRQRQADARRRWWAEATPEQRERFRERQSKPRPQTSAALKGKPKPPRETTTKMIPCDHCGALVKKSPYQLNKFPHQFCSRACFTAFGVARVRAPGAPSMVTCLTCGKEFYRAPGRAKYNNGHHYCSVDCRMVAFRGTKHPHWNGGRQVRDDGYIDLAGSLVPDAFRSMIRQDGRIFEHRLVMAQHLGRPLEDWEIVHHKNGQRADNPIENLELHTPLAHNGITNADRKDVAALRRRIRELEEENAMLKARAT